jgi:hypothetical protein
MTSKRIVFTRADGGVSVLVPAPSGRRRLKIGRDNDGVPILADEPEAAWLDRIRRTDVPADATDVQIVEGDAVPADRSFRDAWVHDKGRFGIDAPKARNIHRDRIRRARKPALEALDVAYQRADEAGDADRKKQIAARKQALRDAPADPRIDAARSPDELQAIWPDDLPRI